MGDRNIYARRGYCGYDIDVKEPRRVCLISRAAQIEGRRAGGGGADMTMQADAVSTIPNCKARTKEEGRGITIDDVDVDVDVDVDFDTETDDEVTRWCD